MTNEICPKCNHKSLRFRSSTKEYVCGYVTCKAVFDENMKEPPVKDALKDSYGNYYKVEIETEPGIIREITTYHLEPGKTTLKGEYPKLNNDSNCKFPDRLSCNSGIGFRRCEFMEYGGSLGYWKCTYKK